MNLEMLSAKWQRFLSRTQCNYLAGVHCGDNTDVADRGGGHFAIVIALSYQ